ncbi:hypothetical protein [Legionella maioricensis]|uniref:DUF883 domain-containing protein n=1 Tax=Legionella maioricensis TaxID=2896528 RepID=A0A9X2D2X2_9GAMM|nr:hypothetical protein [Legionella maioricensis]MCL9685690.1 hypothetical protein [Legionella maioricensis]MCL9689088.1 hypothetical protein [Legionella maioricensis]
MSDFDKNAKEIKNKTAELYDTAKEKAAKAYKETQPKIDALGTQISDTASDLYETGKEKIYQAEDYIEDSITTLSKSIRKQPLTSVLIAAGIGYLFAKFIK